MKLHGQRVLLTGAAGGIGRELLRQLLDDGANVLMTSRSSAALNELRLQLNAPRHRAAVIEADLSQREDRVRVAQCAETWGEGISVLINNAGVSPFALLEQQSPEAIEHALSTNVTAPIDLCRQLLPHLKRQHAAHIVNVGSVFGSVGYPAYSVYSATKFALRGFSEALRRELAGSSVRVHYLAPRATRTSINTPAVDSMNAALGTAVDEPEQVARTLIRLLRADRVEGVIGWPEKLFARINAISPRIVDRALRKQLPIISAHACTASPAQAEQQLDSRHCRRTR